MPTKELKCEFCDKHFVRKSWFDKHSCEKKKRFDAQTNLSVIKAHQLFSHWQTQNRFTKKGGRTKTMVEFSASPYYKAFIKLQEFIAENYLVSGYNYVDWIVAHTIPERDWYSKKTLFGYIEFIQEYEDPAKQANQTVSAMKEWADLTGLDILDFFSTVTPGQALEMIRTNKLAPWVLFGYEDCMDQLTSRFEGEPLYALDDLINTNYWFEKVDSDKSQAKILTDTMDVLLSKYV